MKGILIGLVLFAIAGTYVALACSCAPPESPSKELTKATAVFSGKVVEIKQHEPDINPTPRTDHIFTAVEAVFEVDRSWKGVEKRTISVFTSNQETACGYGFKKEASYLVYAHADDKGRLITSICSRTTSMKSATEDVKELGEGNPVTGGS